MTHVSEAGSSICQKGAGESYQYSIPVRHHFYDGHIGTHTFRHRKRKHSIQVNTGYCGAMLIVSGFKD